MVRGEQVCAADAEAGVARGPLLRFETVAELQAAVLYDVPMIPTGERGRHQILPRGCNVAFFFAIAWVGSLAAFAHSSGPSAAELEAITSRGRLLAEYDTAAWKATDALLATHPKEEPGGRYVARKIEGGWVVDFGRLNAGGDRFLISAEAVEAAGAAQFTVRRYEPAQETQDWPLAAAKAINLAMQDFHGAGIPYNVAVLPSEGNELYVYVYPAQVKERIYPLGADVRYRVSSDGTKMMEKRQLHMSVIAFPPSTASDQKVLEGYHTHVLSDVPEDTDVLHVLVREPRIPELVVTKSHQYTIAVDGKITMQKKSR